ncbi:MAG: peptidogalycan biosysnthesis protein, partial [Porticoccaceae bacterium]
VTTHSLHWIEHPEFHSAIERFLESEQGSVQQHLKQAREILPYRKTG